MDKIYLLETTDTFIKEQALKAFLDTVKDYEVVKYDATIVSPDRVVEDLDTYNFLCNKKCIILDNTNFLSGTIEKKETVYDLTKFIKYLKNPSPENVLLVICTKLDSKVEASKILNKVATKLNTGFSIKNIIKENSIGYKIDNLTISYLIDYCLNDNEKIIMELEKLKLYKYDEKVILKEDINEIVAKTIDDNIFTLLDAIVTKKKGQAIEIYQDMLLHGEEPLHILSLVANQFYLFYSCRILKEDGLKKSEIATSLGIKEYPVQLALQKSSSYSKKEILDNITKLADIDFNYKIGNVNINDAFLMFFIGL